MRDNTDDVSEAGTYEPLPEKQYQFKIKEASEVVSKAGNPLFKAVFEVVNDPNYSGRLVFEQFSWFPKGHKSRNVNGICKHFLHVIGEAYEGDIEILPQRWMNKRFVGVIEHQADKQTGKIYSKIGEYVLPEDVTPQENNNEDVPF